MPRIDGYSIYVGRANKGWSVSVYRDADDSLIYSTKASTIEGALSLVSFNIEDDLYAPAD